MPPNPSLHPTCYSGLRPLPQAGELKRWADHAVGAEKGRYDSQGSSATVSCLQRCVFEDRDLQRPPRALEPCDDAVPVTGDPSPFDSVYIVGVNASSDVQAEAARLSAECGFTVRQVFSLGQGFSAALGPVELGCVRCDPSVTSVYGNTVLYPQ